MLTKPELENLTAAIDEAEEAAWRAFIAVESYLPRDLGPVDEAVLRMAYASAEAAGRARQTFGRCGSGFVPHRAGPRLRCDPAAFRRSILALALYLAALACAAAALAMGGLP